MEIFCLRPPKICHLFCKSSTIAQMQKYFLCRPQYVSTFQACIPPLTCQCCPCISITLPMYNVHLMKMYLACWKKTLKTIFGFLLYGIPFWWLFFCARCMNVLPLKLDPQFVQELSHTWGLFARFVLSIVASHTTYCKNRGTDEIVVFPNDALN